jgi:hypothetical protein
MCPLADCCRYYCRFGDTGASSHRSSRSHSLLRTYGRFAWLYGMIGSVVFNLSAYVTTYL